MFIERYVCQGCGNIEPDPRQYEPCQECGAPSGYDNWICATFKRERAKDAPAWWAFWSFRRRWTLRFMGYDPKDPHISGLPRPPRYSLPASGLAMGRFRVDA